MCDYIYRKFSSNLIISLRAQGIDDELIEFGKECDHVSLFLGSREAIQDIKAAMSHSLCLLECVDD